MKKSHMSSVFRVVKRELMIFFKFMFETNGIIKEVFDTQTFGKGFVKREFILSVRRGENVEDLKFECHGDKVAILDKARQGDLVGV